MPPIGMLLGGVDFKEFFFTISKGAAAGPYATLAAAQEAGAVTNQPRALHQRPHLLPHCSLGRVLRGPRFQQDEETRGSGGGSACRAGAVCRGNTPDGDSGPSEGPGLNQKGPAEQIRRP